MGPEQARYATEDREQRNQCDRYSFGKGIHLFVPGTQGKEKARNAQQGQEKRW
jgi:hypothetical protein